MALRRNLAILSGRIDWKAEAVKRVTFNNGTSRDFFMVRILVENPASEKTQGFDRFYVELTGENAFFAKQSLEVGKYITVEGTCSVRNTKKAGIIYVVCARELNASEDLLFYENDIRIMGYLAEDPMVAADAGGVTQLTVDVPQRGTKPHLDSFRVVAHSSVAKRPAASYRKGDAIAVSGCMLQESFDDAGACILADSVQCPTAAKAEGADNAEASETKECESDIKEALLALEHLPTKETIEQLDPEICQNPDFLESVGSFSKWQRKPDVLVHTLVKAFRAAATDPERLEDMRYALAHFHYYRLVDAISYRYLKLEFVAAQEENEEQILPFQPGEYNFEEDCFWDMKRDALRKAIEKCDAEQRAVAVREEELPYPLTQRVYSKEDAKWQRTPLPEIWKENDVIPTEEDFAWWDKYRNTDGVVDFDLIEDTDYIFFARAKALILMNPEYITQFPMVPYAPGGVLATNACYGLSDVRLFETIINKHYFWLKKYHCQKVRIRRTEEKLAKATEEVDSRMLTEELDALKKELQRLEETKPANAERDALLIRCADRALKVLCTKATDGGYDCIPKKFAIVNPMTYPEYAPVARSEFEIGRPVVSVAPAMMKYAGEDLLNDAEVIFTTYEMSDHDLDVLRFAGKDFFMEHMKAFRGMMEENPAIVTVFARGMLLNEPKFARQAVIWNPRTYQYFKDYVKKYPEVMNVAKDAHILPEETSAMKKILGKYF